MIYTCALCQKTFETDRTDEEALAEFAVEFPGASVKPDDMEIVCDLCFQAMMAAFRPGRRRS